MRSLECRVRKDWHLLFTRHLDVTQLSYALRVGVGRRQGVSPACGYSVCEVVSSLSLSLAGRCGFIRRVAGGLAQDWRKAPRSMDRSRVLATCKGQWSRGQWRGSVLRLPTTTQNRCHRLFLEVVDDFCKGGGRRTQPLASVAPGNTAPRRAPLRHECHPRPRRPGRHVASYSDEVSLFLRRSAAARSASTSCGDIPPYVSTSSGTHRTPLACARA